MTPDAPIADKYCPHRQLFHFPGLSTVKNEGNETIGGELEQLEEIGGFLQIVSISNVKM